METSMRSMLTGGASLLQRPTTSSAYLYKERIMEKSKSVTIEAKALAAEREAMLNAVGKYMEQQYGNTALFHPVDRARILAIRESL